MDDLAIEPAKRGRQRKELPADDAGPKPVKRIKITAYKVRTRHGRFIAGQWVELPEDEADELIAAGQAV